MPEFSPGLEGVVAARTEISEVDGTGGRLIYRGGYLIEELATLSYEEVAHLLLAGELPTEDELRGVREKFDANAALSPAARAALDGVPREADPMDALRTVISAHAAVIDPGKPTVDAAYAYTAVFPAAVAAIYRRRQGQEPIDPRPGLGHAASFLYMATGQEPSADQARWLNTYLVLLADHGLNASTFTCRVIASTGSDMGSALVGGIGALKGAAHGGAATAAMGMLEKIGSADNADGWLRSAQQRKERFMGFGHRVYRTYDPRARILRELAKEANPEFYAVASVTEEIALRLLHEAHPERPNATNVDYWGAGIMQSAGMPKEMFTCLFAMSRVVGWSAHVLEMLKDLRIIRPASEWIGPEPGRKAAPLAERGKAPAA